MVTKRISPPLNAVLSLHTEEQKQFLSILAAEGSDAAMEWLSAVQDKRELSYPLPVLLCWETDAVESLLEIAEDNTFADARCYRTAETTLAVQNLKAGTQYFWRVNGSEADAFYTEAEYPRFLQIDGLVNVRDIGGTDSTTGSRIRQGMVYRGSELNSSFDARYHNLAVDNCFYDITESGKTVFCNDLGIHTDLDLRGDQFGNISASAAGPDVVLQQIPLRPYKEIFLDEHKKNTAVILEFLSDSSCYPVYVHCRGGMDRTGMVVMFLQAICGYSEEALHREYEYSSLCSIGQRKRGSEYYSEFLQMMAEYAPEQSLTEQIIAFLKDCGVSKLCMEKIRSILQE